MHAPDAEDEDEAQEGATTEGNKKAPIDQRMTWFLCNCDNQQCRHCDVVGEVDQCVRQRPRQITRVANDASSYDHSKHRQDKVSNLHAGCHSFERYNYLRASMALFDISNGVSGAT